jgi:hypothetical protein
MCASLSKGFKGTKGLLQNVCILQQTLLQTGQIICNAPLFVQPTAGIRLRRLFLFLPDISPVYQIY